MDKKVICDIKISWVSTFRGKKIMFQMGLSQDNEQQRLRNTALGQNFPTSIP